MTNPPDKRDLRQTIADLASRRWIENARIEAFGLKVMWTPAGAEKAIVLSRIVCRYNIRTFADLAHFDRGCKGLQPGRTVGPKVAEFWNTTTKELRIEDDLDRLFQVLRVVMVANSRGPAS